MAVCGFQCLGDLFRDREGFVDRNSATRETLCEILPLDQLHHERAAAVGFFETVYVGDVRVIQRCEHFGFALKSERGDRDRG